MAGADRAGGPDLASARDDASRARPNATRCVRTSTRAREAATALAPLGESQEREAREAKRFEARDRDAQGVVRPLAGDALKNSSEQFLALAKQTFEKHHAQTSASVEEKQKAVDALLKPIKEALTRTDEKLGLMEKERVGAYEGLLTQVR